MNSRQRFHETMRYGRPDRAPLFQEGIRSEVLDRWRVEGVGSEVDLVKMFLFDRREEFALDLDPHLDPERWPTSRAELADFQRRLDPQDPLRWPQDWSKRVQAWRDRDHILMLEVHEGFFLTMGVGDWRRFNEVMLQLGDDPGLAGEMMAIHGEFAGALADRVLNEVEIDAVIFSEPIGGNTGPLISPRMYNDLVLPGYQPILRVLARHQVKTIILRTYANIQVLLPALVQHGINCLWAVESVPAMDYRELRGEFGPDLRLIGGIDLDTLRAGSEAIRNEMETKVRPLLASGGYIPLADGRVRADISFENYREYRSFLEGMVLGDNRAAR